MVTKIQKWGNSQGLRLGKDLLAGIHVGVGDAVHVEVRGETLVITPARRVRGAHDLEKLVSRIPDGYAPEEADWGAPVGREVW